VAKLRTDFHFALVPKSRSTGFNAVHGAAYRAGERLEDAEGNVYDYTRRQLAREVASTFIVTPSANDWPQRAGRQALWQAAEAAETRKNSVPVYELELAVPHEMPRDLQLEMLHEFAAEFSKTNNVVIDVALHVPHDPDQAPAGAGSNANAGAKKPKGNRNSHLVITKPKDTVDPRNTHAHFSIASRCVTETGFGEKLRWLADNRDIGTAKILHWRARWADIENKYLAKAGIASRVSPLSYKELGIDVEPTQHEGRRGRYSEKRGLRTDVATKNKAKQTADRKARIEAVEIPDDYATPRAELLRQRAEVDDELRRLEDSEEREQSAAKRRKQAAQPAPAPKPAPRPRPVAAAIAPADASEMETWRQLRMQRMLRRYTEVSAELARYWRDQVEADGTVTYSNKGGRVQDHGDQITAAAGNELEIAAMIELAKLKRWRGVVFTGDDTFKAKAMAAALHAGLDITTTTDHDAEILAQARDALAAPKPAPASATHPLAGLQAALDRRPRPDDTPPADSRKPSRRPGGR
jgi:hypothetical protein